MCADIGCESNQSIVPEICEQGFNAAENVQTALRPPTDSQGALPSPARLRRITSTVRKVSPPIPDGRAGKSGGSTSGNAPRKNGQDPVLLTQQSQGEEGGS
jgi:hypothetical protein